MKFYDKDLYKKEQQMKSVMWILILFIVGFLTGYIAFNLEYETKLQEKQNKINEQYIEIDSLKETLYIYEIYGNQTIKEGRK